MCPKFTGLTIVLAFIAASTAPAALTTPGLAAAPAIHALEGVAIGGYDAVSYFDQGRPALGSTAHELRWNGATWRFASAAALATFAANPAAYAPRYGGYCAWAVSQGYIAPGDPDQWKIVDGKLYLNFNARAKELWEADQENAIRRGDANWPTVLRKNQNSSG